MIQFNLLPEVKLAYIKAQRQKRMVTSLAFIITIASLAILVFLVLTVNVVQRKSINDLTKDTDAVAAELRETPDLNKILTVQNQLNALPGLHDQKVLSSRLFGYIEQVTPAAASISSLKVDFADSTMEISGKASTMSTVNVYADSLKLTSYKVGKDGEAAPAFSDVVLSSFARTEEGANYTFTLTFDPGIFAGENDEVILTVPRGTSNRLQVDESSEIFQQREQQE